MEQTDKNITIWIIESCAIEAARIETEILSTNRFARIQKFSSYSLAFDTLCNRKREYHPKIVFLSCSISGDISLLEFLHKTSNHYLSFFFDAHIMMKEFNENCLEKAFENKMTKGWLSKPIKPIHINDILNRYQVLIPA